MRVRKGRAGSVIDWELGSQSRGTVLDSKTGFAEPSELDDVVEIELTAAFVIYHQKSNSVHQSQPSLHFGAFLQSRPAQDRE